MLRNIFKISLIILLTVAKVENRYNAKLTGLHCNAVDRNFIEFTKCYIKAIKRDVAEASITAKLLKPPLDNATLHLIITRRGYEHSGSILNMKMDICDFFRNRHRNPIAEGLYEIFGFEKYSNINHTCPYDHDLIVDRYRYEDISSPLMILPSSEYRVAVTYFVNKKSIAKTMFTVELIEQ